GPRPVTPWAPGATASGKEKTARATTRTAFNTPEGDVAMANISPEEFAEEPEAFKFTEPGDRLIGEAVNVSIVKSSFGNNNRYPLLEVRADGGKLYEVHASPTVLVNQFRRIRPKPGEWVSILFKRD